MVSRAKRGDFVRRNEVKIHRNSYGFVEAQSRAGIYISEASTLLVGLDAIGSYIGCSARMVYRLNEEFCLPIIKGLSRRYWTTAGAIDQWVAAMAMAEMEAKEEAKRLKRAYRHFRLSDEEKEQMRKTILSIVNSSTEKRVSPSSMRQLGKS